MDQTAAEWAARITECRNSGLSVRQWCSDHKIRPQTYYRWQRRLFDMVMAQQQELNRPRISLSRQTMSNWILRATEDYLTPVYE